MNVKVKLRKLFSLVLVGMMLAVPVLDGIASEEQTEDYGGLVVTLGDQTTFFIIKLADELGFLEEEFEGENVSFEVVNFSSGTGLVEAFASGDADFGVSGMLPIISAIAAGQDITVLAASKWTQRGFAYVSSPNSGISTLEELEGKTIGISVGTNTHQVALQLLDAVGLSENDANLVNLSDVLTPLLTDQIDAAVLTNVNLSKAISARATLIADCSYADITITNNFVVRTEFAEEYPDLVTGILKVMKETTEYIYDNKEEALETYSKITQIDYEDGEYAWDLWDHGLEVDDEHFLQPIQDAYDFLVSIGTVEEGLSISDSVNTSYYENIAEN